jgi:hypothetical protein
MATQVRDAPVERVVVAPLESALIPFLLRRRAH